MALVCYRRVPKFSHPMAQCVSHALEGLVCCARVIPASSPASHCKQCPALTSPSLNTRGCASPSRARRGHKKHNIVFNGSKTLVSHSNAPLLYRRRFDQQPPQAQQHEARQRTLGLVLTEALSVTQTPQVAIHAAGTIAQWVSGIFFKYRYSTDACIAKHAAAHASAITLVVTPLVR